MDTPLNLTPERGASVWDAPPSPSPLWPVVAAAGLIIVASLAWRYRSVGKSIVTKSAALGGMLIGVATSPIGRKVTSVIVQHLSEHQARQEARVDAALEDTFPASDPPAVSYRAH